jgi:hypothetical protein
MAFRMMQKNNPVPFSDIENARKIRKMRAVIKADIKNSKVSLEKVLSDKDLYEKCIANMKLIELVSSLPGYGKKSGEKVLGRLKISTCKTIRGLGSRQYANFIKYFNIKL